MQNLILKSTHAYFIRSRLRLFMSEEDADKGLQNLVKIFGNRWREHARKREQYLWNSIREIENISFLWNIICNVRENISWYDFNFWLEENQEDPYRQPIIYLLFQRDISEDFTAWTKECLGTKENDKKSALHYRGSLWAIFQGMPPKEFTQWIKNFCLDYNDALEEKLAFVWLTFHKKQSQIDFSEWVKTFIEEDFEWFEIQRVLENLASVWQIFQGIPPGAFTAWCTSYTQNFDGYRKSEVLRSLAPVWQNHEGKPQNFIEWSNLHLSKLNDFEFQMDNLVRTLKEWQEINFLECQNFLMRFGMQPSDTLDVPTLRNRMSDYIEEIRSSNMENFLFNKLLNKNRLEFNPLACYMTPKIHLLMGIATLWKVFKDSPPREFIKWFEKRTQQIISVSIVDFYAIAEHSQFKEEIIESLALIWRNSLQDDYDSFAHYIDFSCLFPTESKARNYLTGDYLNLIRGHAIWEAEGKKPSREHQSLKVALEEKVFYSSLDMYEYSSKNEIFNTNNSNIEYAKNILKKIKNNGPNYKKLFLGKKRPALWQIYQALYRDFYGRTFDKKGKEEKTKLTLEINDCGELILPYNDDGSLKSIPEVKWTQSLFRHIEYAFFKLLKDQYNEKRVIIHF